MAAPHISEIKVNKNLPVLTSLRFFAAALIVHHHTADFFKFGQDFAHKYLLGQGVTFFFVLSGFILTYNYGHLSGLRNSLSFFWARVAKVWPAHVFMLLVFLFLWGPVLKTGYAPTAGEITTNLLLLQAWNPDPYVYYAFNSVSWTLSVEMFFYLLFPLLIVNFNTNWHWKVYFAVTLALLAIYLGGTMSAEDFNGQEYGGVVFWAYVWPPTYLLVFVLGMVAGQALTKYRAVLSESSASGALGVVAVALMLLGSVVMPNAGPVLQGWGVPISPTANNWIAMNGAAPFYAIGLLLIACSNGLVTKALSVRPMVVLGEISFAMYLTHQVAVRVMNPAWLEALPPAGQAAIYWLFVVAFSYLVWRFVERPCQRLLRRLDPFKSKASQQAAPQSAS